MGLSTAWRPLLVGLIILVFVFPNMFPVVGPLMQLATSGTLFGNIVLLLFISIPLFVAIKVITSTKDELAQPRAAGFNLTGPPTDMSGERFR